MEIRQLRSFISIARLGSFSQAAQLLGYTQSSVTTHIKLLEKELNTVLFERFGSNPILTADGQRLYEYADKITGLAEEAQSKLNASTMPGGPIVIGMPESMCVYHLNDVLQAYVALYPDVELKLRFGISTDFHILLRKNMMDIAFFLETEIGDRDLVSRWLWSEPVVLAASPHHELSSLTRVETKHLRGQTLIFVEPGCVYRTMLERRLARAAVKPRSVLEIGHIQTNKEFAIQNLGITILPLVAVKDEVAAGRLVVLPWQGVELQTSAYMVYHREKWLSHNIRAFIELMEQRLL